MRSLLTLAAFAGFAYGVYDFRKFMKEKRFARSQQYRLEIWESEGGAVPVAATRKAAQVRPQKPSRASPPGVN